MPSPTALLSYALYRRLEVIMAICPGSNRYNSLLNFLQSLLRILRYNES
jgi:hypothetical protein